MNLTNFTIEVELVKMQDLELGDTVTRKEEGQGITKYSHMTVRNKTDKEITFFRPYVVSEDFSYTGGVICYIGIEEFKAPITDYEYILIEKGRPLE